MKHSDKWVGAVPACLCTLLLVMLGLAHSPWPSFGESSGTTGANFLKIAVGPRAAAMGSAYTAVTDEPYALHYNPASVGLAENWELSAMHQTQYGDISFDYFGVSAPVFKNKSGFGVSFVRQAVDDYGRTELDDTFKFVNSDMALTATYAHRIFQPLTLGVSGKIIRQTLAQYDANGWALDFGAHLRLNPRVSLGGSLLHIGPKITFIAVGDPLPTVFRFGAALRLLPRGNLLTSLDYWYPKDGADGVGMGVEYRPSRFIALRGGYQLGTDFSGFNASSLGMTFDFEHFGIEYAFVPREKLGDVHRAGLNVTFGKKQPDVVAMKPRKTSRRREVVQEAPVRQVPKRAPQAPAARKQEETSPYIEPAPRKTVQEPSPAAPSRGAASDMMSLRRTPAVEAPVERPALAPVAAPPKAALRTESAQEERPAAPRLPESSEPDVLVAEPAAPARMERRPYYEMPLSEAVEEAPVVPKAAVPVAEPEETVMGPESREAITQEKVSLASSLMREKRFEEATVIVRSALRDDPRNVPLLYLLSECLYRTGDYDQAMEAVNNALAIIHGGGKGTPSP